MSVDPGVAVSPYVRRYGSRWISLANTAHTMPVRIVHLPYGAGWLRLSLILHVRSTVLQMSRCPTAENATRNGSGTAVARLALPAFRPDCDMLRIQTHQLVYVHQSVVTGGAVYVGDLLPIGIHRVTGDGRTV